MIATQYRQGDVLLIAADAPVDLGQAVTDAEATILARGEATGHRHVLRGPARFYPDGRGSGVGLIEVIAPATLSHEDATGAPADHAPVSLPPGWYRQVQQREYVPAVPSRPAHTRPVRD